ncbi:MAG: rhomboid family intramembrane serine protease [Bacteroidia bacterium]|nr:rhomboid family intramembrane serine protease [Bacteroidia bacterium]
MSFIQGVKSELQRHSKLTIIFALNFALFFLINISTSIFKTEVIINNLALPLNFSNIIFKPWTIITYMFSHQSLGHVFYNMLLLYFSAITFLNFLSEKKLLFVYLVSGLSGALILLIFSLISPLTFQNSILLGASAAVIGIVCSMATYLPNLPINLFGIIEMKYKYYALLVFAVTSIIDFNINTGGKISHFGGAAFGLLFGYLLKQGKDISDWTFYSKPQKKNSLKVVHKQTTHTQANSVIENQKMIDELLDKISKHGYDNLSKSEKELLFKLSNKENK